MGIYPADQYRITGTIEFEHPLIGKQSCSFDITEDQFAEQIGPARTFGFFHEYELLKKFGLARGGSLDNVIVIGDDEVMNPGGLRYPDEFVRHKILDLIGDFALSGFPIYGHIMADKSGHTTNIKFLQKLLSYPDSWELVSDFDRVPALAYS